LRHGWEDHIKIYFKEIGLEVVEWMYLAQCRDQCQAVLNAVMIVEVP
jgi:hypothetical protein